MMIRRRTVPGGRSDRGPIADATARQAPPPRRVPSHAPPAEGGSTAGELRFPQAAADNAFQRLLGSAARRMRTAPCSAIFHRKLIIFGNGEPPTPAPGDEAGRHGDQLLTPGDRRRQAAAPRQRRALRAQPECCVQPPAAAADRRQPVQPPPRRARVVRSFSLDLILNAPLPRNNDLCIRNCESKMLLELGMRHGLSSAVYTGIRRIGKPTEEAHASEAAARKLACSMFRL